MLRYLAIIEKQANEILQVYFANQKVSF